MFHFYCNCVDWPQSDVHTDGGLIDLIDDAKDITRKTFLSHVCRDDLQQLELKLGYESHPSRGLTMSADWHVNYQRSKWHRKTVYLFQHSRIEYVFVKDESQ